MQKIQCSNSKCAHIEVKELPPVSNLNFYDSDEYTCSICGWDSYLTIPQEICNYLFGYSLEEIEDGLWGESLLIAADWNECERIESSKNHVIKQSHDISPMGITVYWVTI